MNLVSGQYYTTQEAGEKLGISARRVRKMIQDGDLKSFMAGAIPSHYIPVDQVDALVSPPKPYSVLPEDAAKTLGVGVAKVRRLVREGRLDAIRHRGKRYISPDSLARYAG